MITLILFALAGAFNAVMDTLKSPTHYKGSIFPSKDENLKLWHFLDHQVSWQRKWAWGTTYLDLDERKEKFWGSSTIFVWVTDGWHLAQAGMIVCLVLAASLRSPMWGFWWDSLNYLCLFCLTFELFFAKLLKRKTWD